MEVHLFSSVCKSIVILGVVFLCSCNPVIYSSGSGSRNISPNIPPWKQTIGTDRVLSYENGILKLDDKVIPLEPTDEMVEVGYRFTNEHVEIYVDKVLVHKD